MASPDLASHRLIFVVGLHRSGTTLLADLLARHSQASGFAVPEVKMNEGQFLQTVMRGPRGEVLDAVSSLGLKRRNHLTERSALATPENRDRLWSEWSAHWDTGKRFLIEKSPGNLVKTPLLNYFFPGSAFILITRDPVAQAMAAKKWIPNRPRFQLLANWARSHDIFARDISGIPHLAVSYEGLCAAPHEVLGQIFDHIGMAHEEVLDRPLSDSNPRYLEAWRAGSGGNGWGADLRLATALFGRSFRRWGYDPRRHVSGRNDHA